MEIASPLSFHRASTPGGTKRQFSPTTTTATSSHGPIVGMGMGPVSLSLDGTTSNDVHPFANPSKRRRFHLGQPSSGNDNHGSSSSPGGFESSQINFFNGNAFGSSTKRARAQPAETAAMQNVIDSQSAEIQSLRAEKESLETTLRTVKSEQGKISEENRILKRGVAIQSDRHNQAVSELNAAKQENSRLKDENGRLEQQVQSLRYQLQAQAYNRPINDFMGFPPRPPDVY